MKYLSLLVLFMCFAPAASAQWNTTTGGIYYNNKVGIGMNLPLTPLHIRHSSAFFEGGMLFENSSATSAYTFINSSNNFFISYNSNYGSQYPQANYLLRMFISSNGNVGIGTSDPRDKLHVDGAISLTPDGSTSPSYINFKRFSDGWIAARIGQAYSQVGYGGHLVFETNTSSAATAMAERMRITYIGNVLIGKTTQTNPIYKLDVNGSVRANEVMVNTTGADFVFSKEYELPKLSDVHQYIRDHKHLPEIESAEEMQTNGVEVGKMGTKLLQKIEELPLYVIDLDNKVQKLNDENDRLRSELQELKKTK